LYKSAIAAFEFLTVLSFTMVNSVQNGVTVITSFSRTVAVYNMIANRKSCLCTRGNERHG